MNTWCHLSCLSVRCTPGVTCPGTTEHSESPGAITAAAGVAALPAVRMDSEVQRDGRILDLIDDAWREDKLPYEDVAIPLNELPEPEQDNGGTTESVKEQEMKWTDLALQYLHENVPPTGN
ncbi:anaphase-promoting complex subunit 13 isoform X1 [Pithys albifrons albifrons]|uniref:anaphase-promoting complex subunit 13 isoform X1 n=1 Tax=Pithys albifrons albifrons TaxID=3385563 RepID=UPI003A5CB1E8